MHSLRVALLGASIASAFPAVDIQSVDKNALGRPFVNAILPAEQSALASHPLSLFKRQGCPTLTLACPGNICCPYDASCCGSTCCPSGYLCTGGSPDAPCCVAMDSPTNSCDTQPDGNPCERPGDVQCNGINICCPPDNYCYYDAANNARCSPMSASSSVIVPLTSSSTEPVSSSTSPPESSSVVLPVTTTSVDPGPLHTDPPPDNTDSDDTTTDTDDTITTHHKHSFWTPVTIGAIAGGAGGGILLIILIVTICCCCHCCTGGSSKESRRSSSAGPFVVREKRVPRLLDSEIATLVYDVISTEYWQTLYTNEAQRMSTNRNVSKSDRVTWMLDFSRRAVGNRVSQLQSSGDFDIARIKAGAIGAIPFVKYWGVVRDSTKTFNTIAIWGLGMGNADDARNLQKEAKAAADKSSVLAKISPGLEFVGKHAFKLWWADSDLAAHLQQELAGYLAEEMGTEAATSFLSDLLHFKPVVGQVVSGTRAALKTDQKMVKALNYLQAAALEFHAQVFVVNALAEVFPPEFGQDKEPYVHVSEP